jgi:UDP-N-acetylmuramoyl-tripeptide--D-alanyl-D-alanine ligase
MVTNVGSSHLEYLKTRENIAKAKLEIAEGLTDGGYLLLNGDEPLLYTVKPQTDAKINTVYVTVEDNDDCSVRASNIRVGERETLFDLCCLGVTYKDLKINLAGKAFVYNACFAACAAQLLGASEDDIRDGLLSYVPSGMRQSVEKKDGITSILDCYNAAPESMRSAIDTLMAQKISGRRIAVLGDMRELGEGAVDMHVGVGKYAAEAGVDKIFTLGELGESIARGAREAGMSDDSLYSCLDIACPEALADALRSTLNDGDAVLFKASRSVGMERVAHAVFDK